MKVKFKYADEWVEWARNDVKMTRAKMLEEYANNGLAPFAMSSYAKKQLEPLAPNTVKREIKHRRQGNYSNRYLWYAYSEEHSGNSTTSTNGRIILYQQRIQR